MNVVLETLRKYPSEFNVFFYIGLGMIVRLGLKFLSSLYIFLLRPSKNLNKFGKWAIVTGATDGIGKGLAMELAKKGMNVVLISRTQARLDEVKKLIEEKYTKVQIRTLAIDFNDIEQKTVQISIQKLINDIQDVGVLFNNVGVSYDFPQV
jgi:17beta-estradiol 17-dehydrogenase / very-long-chain 3-oxoacyl-CoA reductase